MYYYKRITILYFLVPIVLVCTMEYDLVFADSNAEVRCIEREREALLRFKEGLTDSRGVLSTWGREDNNKECCNWYGVGCSNITGHVQVLDLRESNLAGVVPPQLWNLTNLRTLGLSRNNLEGTITEAELTKLRNLTMLDLSFNSLILRINPGWTPPFQLDFMSLSGCNMGPRFPLWLRTQGYFSNLDISRNGISGDVPKWFWSLYPAIQYLNLSHNNLSGTVPDFSQGFIDIIDVSSNKFSGPIPLFPPRTLIFQLSHNMFSGPISSICVFLSPSLIDLSDNQLTGKIPNCWQKMTFLFVLSLTNNSFSGEIPPSLGSLFILHTLHLGHNNLSGNLPSTLKNCQALELFDIGDNMLTGSIPTWIGAYHESLTYLIFRNNRFEGSIPPQICSLSQIQVLDLSGNNLSGNIPSCFGNFTHLVQTDTTNYTLGMDFGYADIRRGVDYYINYATVSWKSQLLEYRGTLKLLKLVDLSSNRLLGDIPKSFSSLRGLVSLNLSWNGLTGNINPDIGRMEMLECLDLPSNRLSGAMPIGMTRLDFLAVLDLANNNLSGKIPSSTQLQSFEVSAYAGNPELCGSPLPLCRGDDPNPSTNNKAEDIDEKDDGEGILSFPFLKGLVISIILGFIFGFWGVVGSLTVKKSWRRAYFNFWDAVANWLYVTTAIFWAKLIRRS